MVLFQTITTDRPQFMVLPAKATSHPITNSHRLFQVFPTSSGCHMALDVHLAGLKTNGLQLMEFKCACV